MQDWSLSSLDISFLAIETPNTPSNLGAVVLLDAGDLEGGPGFDGVSRLAAVLGERAGLVPRLRRRLRSDWLPPGGASWAEDPGFEAARHIHVHRTLGRGGPEELAAWVGRTVATPLDRARPLWELHLLWGLCLPAATGGAGADRRGPDLPTVALLVKFHHAFVDGVNGGAVLAALVDGGSAAAVPEPAELPDRPFAAPRALARRTLGPLAGLSDPKRLARLAASTLATATGVVQSMARPPSGLPFDTTVGPQRHFAMSSVCLTDVRAVRKAHGGMANDVLVSLVAGAARTWLAKHNHDPDGVDLRAMIPVAGRRTGGAGASGNNFSAFLIDLPVAEPDPLVRLHRVRTQMEHHKDVGPEGGAGAVAGLTNILPPVAVRLGGPLLATHAARLFDVLVTTVPIPRPASIGGAAVREVYPIAPLAQGQPLGVALSTYRGRAYVGITADPVVVPDPAGLAAAVPEALADLMAAAGVAPSEA